MQDTRVACGMCRGGCRTSVLASGVGITELTSMLQVAAATPPPTPFWNSPQVQGAFIALSGVVVTAVINSIQKDKEIRHQKRESEIKRVHESAANYLKLLGEVSVKLDEIDSDIRKTRQSLFGIDILIEDYSRLRTHLNEVRPIVEEMVVLESKINTQENNSNITNKLIQLSKFIDITLTSSLVFFENDNYSKKLVSRLGDNILDIRKDYILTISYLSSLVSKIRDSIDLESATEPDNSATLDKYYISRRNLYDNIDSTIKLLKDERFKLLDSISTEVASKNRRTER
ncbi:hypothetical protein [Deinococcus aquaticus]|uniref:Uncharacterized protein n=1 Tax=Deinococcus aquaticus TaxID=328692 RepID=A0ABY7UZ74_9DEIO|nr:hypothetical protein [Deinococcus aquaticus]WDA58150.1 hypothetical protein M8445_12440 [Deinococcus aquaticus]